MYEGLRQLNYGQNNEQMYNQALAGYKQMTDQAQTNINMRNKGWVDLYNQQAQYGKSQQLDLDSEEARRQAMAAQSMASRGMFNSSAYDAAMRGVNQDTDRARLTLQDQLLARQGAIKQNQLGALQQGQQYLSQLQGSQAQFMGQAQQARQLQDVNLANSYDERQHAMLMQQLQGAQQGGMQTQQLQFQANQNQAARNLQQSMQNQGFAQQFQMANTFGY